MEYVILGKVTAKEYHIWRATLNDVQREAFIQFAKDNLKLIKDETWDRYLHQDRYSIDVEWRQKQYEKELEVLNAQVASTPLVQPFVYGYRSGYKFP